MREMFKACAGFLVMAMVALVVVAGIFSVVTTFGPPAHADRAGDAFAPIKTRGVTIVGDSGETVAYLGAASDGAGLWLNRDKGDGPMVALFTTHGQAGIGFYPNKKPADRGGMPLALTLDDKGRPFLQIRDDKGVRFVDLAKLVEQK